MDQILNFFNNQNIISLFFKAFAICFSLIYLFFAIVILKQTQVMSQTVQSKTSSLIFFISLIQLFIGIALFSMAILII